MKKRLGLLLAVSAMALGLGGAFVASAANNKVNSLQEADAAVTDSTFEIRFTRPGDWGGSTPKVHTWYSGQGGVDHSMIKLWDNEYGQSVYSWSPSSTNPLRDYINIHNDGWSYQTGDMAAPTKSTFIYYDNGWQKVDVPTMDIYLYDYDNRFNGTVNVHIWRDNGSGGAIWEGDSWPGNAATQLSSIATNGLVYKFTMNNRYNRVIFSANGSKQTENLTPTGNYCYVLANDDTTLEGKNSWWGNINYVFAHNFSQNTMLMRSIPTSDQSSTQYCAARYSAAETHFNALMESGYGEYVLPELKNNFADAMDRLAAWAAANGKSLDLSEGTLSAHVPVLMTAIVTDTRNMFPVIVSSLVLLLVVGGYFLLRKKRI